MTLKTPAALYNSPRVDSGHILSMRGRACAPDDTERESERQERDCEPKTGKREKQRVRERERTRDGGTEEGTEGGRDGERERERERERGSVKRAGAPRDRESRLE